MARLLIVPDYIRLRIGDVCDVYALRAVAAMSEPAKSVSVSLPTALYGQHSARDLRRYLNEHGIEYREAKSDQGLKLQLDECPFNSDHKSPDSFVAQYDSGMTIFSCSHDSCSQYKWADFRLRIGDPKQPQISSTTPFIEGERVHLDDRGNVGTVQQDDGGPVVTVQIVGKSGNACTKDFPRSEVQSIDGPTKEPKVFEVKSAWDAVAHPARMRECVIEGLVRRGEVVNVVASTKVGKSWLALGLLFCVSTGRDWLKRRVLQGNVLLLDNELHDETIQNRTATVAREMNLLRSESHSRFDYIPLRGESVNI
ncbi:MAG: AAA family ATPase [Planctomycetaceae bacterium]